MQNFYFLRPYFNIKDDNHENSIYALTFFFFALDCSSAPAGSPKEGEGKVTSIVSRVLSAPLYLPNKIKDYRASNVKTATLEKQRAENKLKQNDKDYQEAQLHVPVGNTEHNNWLKLKGKLHQHEANVRTHEKAGILFDHAPQPFLERADKLKATTEHFHTELKGLKSKGVAQEGLHWDHVNAHLDRQKEQKAIIARHDKTIRRNSGLWPF